MVWESKKLYTVHYIFEWISGAEVEHPAGSGLKKPASGCGAILPPRALTQASGHVTPVHVLSQFHSLRTTTTKKKKGFHHRWVAIAIFSIFIHLIGRARERWARAVDGCGRSARGRMRLNDETPHMDVISSKPHYSRAPTIWSRLFIC